MRSHNASKIHVEVPERTIDRNDVTKDCIATGTRALKEKKLREYAENREMFFTGISAEHIYSNDITPPPGSPVSHPDFPLSHPPTPQALHDALAPFELEQATEAGQTGSFLADLEDGWESIAIGD
jgi:hypothetical protein